MPQSDAPTPPAAHSPLRDQLIVSCSGAVAHVPRKLRTPILIGWLVVVALALYVFVFSSSATLNLVCRHNLRSAELSVLVDGKLAHSEQISGSAKKRFGLLDTRIEGSFSKSLAVSAGRHVVKVRLRSTVDGFDQTKVCGVNVVPGQNATVIVSTSRGGMSLAYHGPPVNARTSETVSGYFGSLGTLLVTVLGSAVSAAIGFVVQEALRSRKTSLTAQNQNS